MSTYDGPVFDLPKLGDMQTPWIKGVSCNTVNTSCLYAGKDAAGNVVLTSTYDPSRTVVTATPDEWADFVAAVREGTFDAL